MTQMLLRQSVNRRPSNQRRKTIPSENHNRINLCVSFSHFYCGGIWEKQNCKTTNFNEP